METQALHRRRVPRASRTWDPLFETAAITLLVLLVFFLVVV